MTITHHADDPVVEDHEPLAKLVTSSVPLLCATFALGLLAAAGLYAVAAAGFASALEELGLRWEPALATSAVVLIPAGILTATFMWRRT